MDLLQGFLTPICLYREAWKERHEAVRETPQHAEHEEANLPKVSRCHGTFQSCLMALRIYRTYTDVSQPAVPEDAEVLQQQRHLDKHGTHAVHAVGDVEALVSIISESGDQHELSGTHEQVVSDLRQRQVIPMPTQAYIHHYAAIVSTCSLRENLVPIATYRDR